MGLTFHRGGLLVLAGVLLLVAIAVGEVELGLAAVLGTTTIVEILTWLGPLTGSGDAGPERHSGR